MNKKRHQMSAQTYHSMLNSQLESTFSKKLGFLKSVISFDLHFSVLSFNKIAKEITFRSVSRLL